VGREAWARVGKYCAMCGKSSWLCIIVNVCSVAQGEVYPHVVGGFKVAALWEYVITGGILHELKYGF
jgi:hypothetical protein